jgi:hypothetical protein
MTRILGVFFWKFEKVFGIWKRMFVFVIFMSAYKISVDMKTL